MYNPDKESLEIRKIRKIEKGKYYARLEAHSLTDEGRSNDEIHELSLALPTELCERLLG